MKRREYTLEPETVAEKDGITALKLVVESYWSSDYFHLFSGGKLMAEVEEYWHDEMRRALESVETDDSGRDANGIDIRAALATLENVKRV